MSCQIDDYMLGVSMSTSYLGPDFHLPSIMKYIHWYILPPVQVVIFIFRICIHTMMQPAVALCENYVDSLEFTSKGSAVFFCFRILFIKWDIFYLGYLKAPNIFNGPSVGFNNISNRSGPTSSCYGHEQRRAAKSSSGRDGQTTRLMRRSTGHLTLPPLLANVVQHPRNHDFFWHSNTACLQIHWGKVLDQFKTRSVDYNEHYHMQIGPRSLERLENPDTTEAERKRVLKGIIDKNRTLPQPHYQCPFCNASQKETPQFVFTLYDVLDALNHNGDHEGGGPSERLGCAGFKNAFKRFWQANSIISGMLSEVSGGPRTGYQVGTKQFPFMPRLVGAFGAAHSLLHVKRMMHIDDGAFQTVWNHAGKTNLVAVGNSAMD
ncbi:hypothetical protein V8D89_009381 [Ganoderma adspersum]